MRLIGLAFAQRDTYIRQIRCAALVQVSYCVRHMRALARMDISEEPSEKNF